MPERDIRLRIFVDDSNIKKLAAMTTLLQKAAAAEKSLTGAAGKKNKAIRKQAGVVKKDTDAIDKADKSTRSWTQQITKNIGKVAEWGIATGLIYGSIRTLRTAIDDVIDVEFAMAGLTKVMQDGKTRAKSLRGELLMLGHQYGELGDSVIESATEFARLQLSNFELAQSTEAGLLAQAVAEMQVVDASKFLIASMQQFEQTALSNIRTLDQWNELSNRMAVRALDLAQASARAGSVIHNAGDDMAYLNGMTAALVQATGRSGQEIGMAIRTFGTYTYRLRSVALLEKAGIKVRNEATGQLKGFGDVISDSAIKWVTFTDVQKRAIAQAIAGTRRQNEFLTLMREYPEVMRATEIALDSFGSAQEESAILLDTAQKKAEQFRSGLQRLAAEYGNTKPFKLFLDGLNALINALIEMKAMVFLFAGAMTVLAAKAILTTAVVAKLKIALMGLAAAHPVLLALSIAAAASIAIYSALNREAEDYLTTILEMTQRGIGLVKTEEQRAKVLEVLIGMYRNQEKALAAATDPAKIERFTNNLSDLSKQIETAGRAGDRAFKFDLSDAEASLKRASELVDVLRKSAADMAKEEMTNARSRIDLVREHVDLAELYMGKLKETGNSLKAVTQASDELGISKKELLEKLKEVGLAFTSTFSTQAAPADINKTENVVKDLRATLAGLEKELGRLRMKEVFHDAVQELIDMKQLLHDIRMEMQANAEAARHMAAMARFSGATPMDALRMAGDAIRKNIGLVQGHITELKAQGEETTKLEAIVDGLNNQLKANSNRIKEANQAYRDDAISEYIKRRKDSIKVLSQAAIQRAKDTGNLIGATELEIKALESTRGVYQTAIRDTDLYGHSTIALEKELRDLNREIAIKTERLNEVIKPQERSRRLTELMVGLEADLKKRIDENNTTIERQIQVMQAAGRTEETIARIRVNNAARNLTLSRRYVRSMETELELKQALKDAEIELEIAIKMRQLAQSETALERGRTFAERQIELSKAMGATGVQVARMQIEALRQEGKAVASSRLTWREKFVELLRLSREMEAATHDLSIAEATAARQAADAWIKEYERRKDAWAKLIGRGLSRKGVMETLERIQQEMVDRWVRSAFEPLIEKLTQWEYQMLGISPEQIRIQEENRNKMIMALRTGGDSVQKSIMTGADYHAGAIKAAMQTQPMGGGQFSLPGAVTAGGGGDTLYDQLYKDFYSQGVASPTASQAAAPYALSMGPTILSNIPDWTTGRGGGYRAAGYGGGALIGGLISKSPQGAALGGQIGMALVSALQDLKRAIWEDTEERKRPQAESLREQVGSAINRGTFGSAANITYHVENNFDMSYLVPDREQVRRVVALLHNELGEYQTNVSVGA